MRTPTIDVNGTSHSALQEAYQAAYRALNEAIRVLAATNPNERDYDVQGPGAYKEAAAEWVRRLETVAGVRDEMLALYEAAARARRS